jgi:hypothetical protein
MTPEPLHPAVHFAFACLTVCGALFLTACGSVALGMAWGRISARLAAYRAARAVRAFHARQQLKRI